ncbi:protein Dok-7 [Rhynchocyon petersi]
MTEAVLVEGQVKLRDGKKWKTRWLLLRKPSPVADCLLMLAYKDRAERTKGLRERSSLTLEDICGLEPGLPYEGLVHTLAIICRSQAIMLGFETREAMCAWDARIRYALGEVHRFHVTVAPGTKLQSGPATLHLCNDILVVARDVPPTVTGQWKLSDLRRYGAVPSGFIFEGGTRCGYWAGVFFLSSAEGEQITFLFDCIVRGISPTKGPFGLRPVLPDPSAGGTLTTEDRATQETLQLEKRLSLLSHSGRPGSRGEDRSLSSSSSEAGHSDVSAGSRLATWPEPSSSSASTSQEGLAAARALHLSETSASGELVPGTSQPPSRPLRPRQLQEVGRQGSSDSGIATGSHSSCSGSFSSYAGSSLDVWPVPDDFGSLLSLPSTPGAPEPHLCACPPATVPWAAEYQVPGVPRPHYDTPRSLRQAPRDQGPAAQGSPDGGTAAAATTSGDSAEGCPSSWPGPERRGPVAEAGLSSPVSGEPWEAGGAHVAPGPAGFSACPVCGGYKVRPLPEGPAARDLMPHLWDQPPEAQSIRRGTHSLKGPTARCWIVLGDQTPHWLCGAGPRVLGQQQACAQRSTCVTSRDSEARVGSSCACHDRALESRGSRLSDELASRSCSRWDSEGTLSMALPSADGESEDILTGVLFGPGNSTLTSWNPSTPFRRSEELVAMVMGFLESEPKGKGQEGGRGTPGPGDSGASSYVNLPVSPPASRQLHYLGLELHGARLGVRGAGASRYAHIDITATEAAHRVGSQHAQTREEQLAELQHRRRAQP